MDDVNAGTADVSSPPRPEAGDKGSESSSSSDAGWSFLSRLESIGEEEAALGFQPSQERLLARLGDLLGDEQGDDRLFSLGLREDSSWLPSGDLSFLQDLVSW